nr:unnamed protein product [Callosobruchus chinensis]
MLKRSLSLVRSNYSTAAFSVKEKLKAKSWKLHEYGDVNNLRLEPTRLPIIRKPNEVLVQVEAASVNPIDLYMIGGYGHKLFQIPRNFELEFPLVLGRDFAGTVISTGHAVSKIKVGDAVYGFVPLHKPGSFAEVVLTDACHVQPRPKHLNPVESASLVYSTMTAWSALFLFGNLLLKSRDGRRVLILGASGGVGTAAVQLLKSQNCVRGTDSDFIKEKTEEYLKKLIVLGPKEKYGRPLSENQRYGWYQARLTTAKWEDRKLYHHKHMDVIVKEQMMSYQKIINR